MHAPCYTQKSRKSCNPRITCNWLEQLASVKARKVAMITLFIGVFHGMMEGGGQPDLKSEFRGKSIVLSGQKA